MANKNNNDTKYLFESIAKNAYDLGVSKQKIPSFIIDNLKHNLFFWQEEALTNFLTYQKIRLQKSDDSPLHLMFNMATGSGKTLIMAALILYYYKKGYRHFMFFVNQNNIIDKTENNFIQSNHNKYLFQEKIVIDDKIVNIKQVENFSDNPSSIEIKFTSVHKLYNDIHIEKENKTTLDDLHNKNIVMLADEAHHLNANTKNVKIQDDALEKELKGNVNEVEKKGWEHTIIDLILKKNNKNIENKNVLLEFSATIPENKEVVKKYEDKIIAKFDLKDFLGAGFTKEINLISTNAEKKERIILSLLFNWYRHKIALKHNLGNFKPVILFRSKLIEDSKKDYEEFLDLCTDINIKDFDFLKEINAKTVKSNELNEQGSFRINQILDFIKNNKINYQEIVDFIKNNFQDKNVIITNSKKGTKTLEKTDEDQERLLNSLEDKNNHIRAIFTVQRLTEGWDVLNLFDIVRLYEGRDEGREKSGKRKAGSATISEKQLIGRGVRYFPFNYKDKLKNQRKFDDDLSNELRILEELCFYSENNEKYINELKKELKKDGYFKENRIIKTFDLKQEFKESEFCKKVKIWLNEPIDNPNRRKANIEDLENEAFEYSANGFELRQESKVFDKESNIKEVLYENRTLEIKVKDISRHIFKKALNIKATAENSLFKFQNLSKEIKIETIDDFQSKILSNFKIKVKTSNDNQSFHDISNNLQLNIVLKFLNDLEIKLKANINPKNGSEFFFDEFLNVFGDSKTKAVKQENEEKELVNNKWYVLDGFVGTSEEKALVKFVSDSIGNLKDKFSEIYLLRNEEVYKIYNFKDARGFQPDFILFLKKKNTYYQVLIEAKGDQFKDKDGSFQNSQESWKEEFLKAISSKYSEGISSFNQSELKFEENDKYRIIGLPLFNEDEKTVFEQGFAKIYQN